jgi:hypothetical protein
MCACARVCVCVCPDSQDTSRAGSYGRVDYNGGGGGGSGTDDEDDATGVDCGGGHPCRTELGPSDVRNWAWWCLGRLSQVPLGGFESAYAVT